jgi:hypothetical protein
MLEGTFLEFTPTANVRNMFLVTFDNIKNYRIILTKNLEKELKTHKNYRIKTPVVDNSVEKMHAIIYHILRGTEENEK